MMKAQRFKSIVAKAGARALVPLPFNPDEVWGTKPRHYVTGSVNGHTVRGLLFSDGTQFFLPLGAAWRRDSGIEVGSQAEVELTPEGPQGEQLAPDIEAALEAEPEARAFFEGLATFYRKNFVRWIESAKRPTTRSVRIQEMIGLLRAGERQR